MEDKRFCPECNAPLEGDEAFCDNCGASLKGVSAPIETEENSGTIASSRDSDGDDISRNNVMGNINKSTTNNTSNSVTTNKVDNSTSTSNVTTNSSVTDNSVVHNNNTTIVMGGKNEAEFCEVCGNPFEGKHARCPKCGKSICFDCKVKGKNRCIECEKKAINEYRLAFQELLMTTNGNIGVSGRQIMNRKAQELDVEDKKKAIEEELAELYKPQTKPQQPTVIIAPEKPEPQLPNAGSTQTPEKQNKVEKEPEQKGVGALSGRKPLVSTPKNSGGGSKIGIYIIIGAIIIIAAYLLLVPRGGDSTTTEQTKDPVEVAVEKENTPKAEQPKPQAAEKPQVVQQEVQESVSKPEPPKTEPAAPVTDSNYDAGMKAYNAGNGLEAIKFFKASGSAQSYYMLGLIYESGCGNVSKNAMMARQNFKKAAQMGSSEAKEKL